MKATIGDLLKQKYVEPLRQVLEESSKVVILTHMTPDGDAIGSSLALNWVLRGMGKWVKVITPDMAPKNLQWMPGAKEIMVYTHAPELAEATIAEADTVCCLDFNAPYRIDRVSAALVAASGKKVLIDHHLDPEEFVDVCVSRPEMSSTCALLYEVLCDLGWKRKITRKVAECLYTGMMTDTGNFTYNSRNPELYTAIAYFVELGVDKDQIYNLVCNSNSVNRLRLNGYALSEKMEVYPEHRAALITLTQEELNRFHYERGDTESLVNKPLSVPEIVCSVFLREEREYIKVSTRSRGDYPVNELCERFFGGGGHKNAAGGEFRGTMEEAVATVRRALPEFDEYLPKKEDTK